MGNVNNTSTEGFRGEQVVSAEYVERPKTWPADPDNQISNHHGVVMHTDKGNKYLLHSTPDSGTVVTDAPMSDKWKTTHEIPVNGTKTVGQVFNESSGRTNNKLVNYFTSGTCIMTASNAEKALKE